MQIVALTTCTDRKRFPVPPQLDAADLRPGRQASVVQRWRKRTSSASVVAPATRVYCGRSFQEALIGAKKANADFRIISGGLGLLRGDQLIPSYSLSLVRQSKDFIGSKVTDETFSPHRWWREVQYDAGTQPISELVCANPNAVVVIGISNSYLSLIAEDLASLDRRDVPRIRLIGKSIENVCPPQLQQCILPYDDRLDGPDSVIRGTRGDFSSRAMRHFIECVLLETKTSSLTAHKAMVSRLIALWRAPKPISRVSKTDDEIVHLIKRSWKSIQGQSSRGLRHLRDVDKVACEQGRFRILFHRAAKQVMQ